MVHEVWMFVDWAFDKTGSLDIIGKCLQGFEITIFPSPILNSWNQL